MMKRKKPIIKLKPHGPVKGMRLRKKVKPENGRIIYKGPNHMPGGNGEEIIAIMTFGSKNMKTGDLWTVFYFPSSVLKIPMQDGNLLKFIQSGGDQGVCIGCIHGSKGDGDCYTFLGLNKGPARMIQSLQARINRGENVFLDPMALTNLLEEWKPMVRLGGYGDPVSMPLDLLELIVEKAGSIVGYTHTWNRMNDPIQRAKYARFLMASVDTEMQAVYAQAKGWRTFRVGQKGQKMMKSEFNCPASKEMKAKIGKTILCNQCKKCNGNLSVAKNVFILSHGALVKRYKPLNVLAS